MKLLKRFDNRPEADILKGFLESAGIHAHVESDDQGGLRPVLSVSKGANVHVADDQFEEALELMKNLESSEDSI